MKKALVVLAAAGLAVLGASAPTRAGIVTVDPDLFPSGTDISNSFPGVTLLAVGSGVAGPQVYSYGPANASTPPNVFANRSWYTFPFDSWFYGTHELRVSFDAPTDFVSIDALGDDVLDYAELRAYDATDTLLASVISRALSSGQIATLTLSRPTPEISYVLASGSHLRRDDVQLDNLRYNRIPEPGTLSLFGIAAAAALLRRRKRGA